MVEDAVRGATLGTEGEVDTELHQHILRGTRVWTSDGADLDVGHALARGGFSGLVCHAWDESHSAGRLLASALKHDKEVVEVDRLLVTGRKPYSLAKFVSTSDVFRKKFGDAQVAASVAPHVVWANVAMQRGPFSVTQGHLEDHVLQWLQADPYWSELGRRAADHLAGEEEFKHEVGGYTGRQAPGCNTCNTIDMGRPLQATRVSAWVRCFLQRNRRWLTQLTKGCGQPYAHCLKKSCGEAANIFLDVFQ